MMTRRLFIFIFSLVLHVVGLGQVTFVTKVSSTSIGKNDLIEVSYEVQNGDIEQFVSPGFNGWQVLGGPNIKSTSLTINGQKSVSSAYQYILKPLSVGRLSLPAAKANINGKMMSTNAVEIEVGSQSSAGSLTLPGARSAPGSTYYPPSENEDSYDGYLLREGENATEKIGKNLFLKVVLSKNSCYEGEPIVADYQLFSRVSLNAKIARSPSFTGFSSIDLRDAAGNDFDVARIGGKVYKVYRVRKVQLYPLQSGKMRLEPVEIDATVQFRRVPSLRNMNSYDPYSPDNYVVLPFTVKSDPIEVDVLPLPTAGKPAGMDNAVGRFDIKARWLQNQLQRGQAGTLQIELSGIGNWAMVTPPQPNWPKGLEVYEPAITENIDSQSVPVKGSRLFKFNFTAKSPGWIVIPPVRFVYFDPWTKTYIEKKTDSLQIEVINSTYAGEPAREPVSDSETDYTEVFTDIITIVFPLLAAILIGITMWRNTKKRKLLIKQAIWQAGEGAGVHDLTSGLPTATAHRHDLLLNPGHRMLSETQQDGVSQDASVNAAQSADPYTAVATAKRKLIEALQTKWQIGGNDLSRAGQLLQTKGLAPDKAANVEQALQQCDAWLYSPYREMTDAENIMASLDASVKTLSAKLL